MFETYEQHLAYLTTAILRLECVLITPPYPDGVEVGIDRAISHLKQLKLDLVALNDPKD